MKIKLIDVTKMNFLIFLMVLLLALNFKVAHSQSLSTPSFMDKDLHNSIHEFFQSELFNPLEYNGLAIQDQLTDPRQITHMPDTVVVYSVQQNPRRHLYFYNLQGQRTSWLTQSLVSNNWTNLSAENYTYDQSGNRLTVTTQSWQNNAWINVSKRTNTFGQNNVLSSTLLQNWTGSGWVNSKRVTNSHDAQDNLITRLDEDWVNGGWQNDEYVFNTYDGLNNLLTSTFQDWNGQTWINVQQLIHSYNDAGLRSSSLIQDWFNQEWVDVYQEQFTYNNQNLVTTYLSQVMENDDWVNSNKFTYAYSAQGFRTSALGEQWTENAWRNFVRNTYSHNIYGGIQSSLLELWIDTAWENFSLLSNVYDGHGNTLVSNAYRWDGNTWSQSADGMLELYYSNSSFIIYFVGYKADASYKSTTVGLNETGFNATELFHVYPNPSQGEITISYNLPATTDVQLVLFDLAGKVIEEQKHDRLASGEGKIFLQNNEMRNGTYLLQVRANEEIFHKRLIINK